jgi:hypothetical protein
MRLVGGSLLLAAALASPAAAQLLRPGEAAAGVEGAGVIPVLPSNITVGASVGAHYRYQTGQSFSLWTQVDFVLFNTSIASAYPNTPNTLLLSAGGRWDLGPLEPLGWTYGFLGPAFTSYQGGESIGAVAGMGVERPFYGLWFCGADVTLRLFGYYANSLAVGFHATRRFP